MEKILIDGAWQTAEAIEGFKAHNPATGEELAREFPVSSWADCERALNAAVEAQQRLRRACGEQLSAFLAGYADRLEARADELVTMAHTETGLPEKPRLRDAELPRTTTQLRQAAAAALEGSWMQPVIDTRLNIRSCFAPIGPVVVFGPNNFPFAFNGVSGGDFAAAIAVGCPVIAKAHPLHPATSQLLAECANEARIASGLPSGTVQMLYHLRPEDGLRLVADARVGATSFTGSRGGGLRLKQAAESAGRPIYLELSSINPIVFLPGALAERLDALVTETADSGLAGAGQFCTSPNLLFLLKSAEAVRFVDQLGAAYAMRPAAPLLAEAVCQHLQAAVTSLVDAGASVVTGAVAGCEGSGFRFPNTVLRVTGRQFLNNTEALQKEAFGNATMAVVCDGVQELLQSLAALEGNLTASIYSSHQGSDDALYADVAAMLRPRCGRLLNDKMPTGVALSPAMNHGGPYPSTAHPGFTSVGIPRSMQRFGALQCFDAVRQDRLPPALRDRAPNASIWRMIDGAWVRGDAS